MNFATLNKMRNFVDSTNYQVIQANGQRIYSPSSSSGILPPPKGTEIFIGNLPPDLYEDELIPIFSKAGAIYSLRLMMDFFGRNRGYAFLAYFRVEDAHRAVFTLNHFCLRARTKIVVTMSVDNRRLFIGNIPTTVNELEVRFTLGKLVDGISEVILYKEPYDDSVNRGYVFVEFETHRLAAIARRQLSPGNLYIWGQSIYVDWAEPLPTVDPDILKTVAKLYVNNLPINLDSEQLRSIIYRLVDPGTVLKVHKMHNYAFIHFCSRKHAEAAFRKIAGLVIDAKVIGVEWARPIEYSKQYREGTLPETFCKSVPPNMRRALQLRRKSKNSNECSDLLLGHDYLNFQKPEIMPFKN